MLSGSSLAVSQLYCNCIQYSRFHQRLFCPPLLLCRCSPKRNREASALASYIPHKRFSLDHVSVIRTHVAVRPTIYDADLCAELCSVHGEEHRRFLSVFTISQSQPVIGDARCLEQTSSSAALSRLAERPVHRSLSTGAARTLVLRGGNS